MAAIPGTEDYYQRKWLRSDSDHTQCYSSVDGAPPPSKGRKGNRGKVPDRGLNPGYSQVLGSRRSSTPVKTILVALVSLAIGWGLCAMWGSSATDITDPTVHERIRREWNKEYQQHQSQVAKMQEITERWASEIQGHQSDRLDMKQEREEWEAERREHEKARSDERQEWEKVCEEREKIRRAERELELARKNRELEKQKEEDERKKYALKWQEPAPDDRCWRYGTRRYTARLENVPDGYDTRKACYETKALIHGRWLKPDICEDKGAWVGTIGKWFIDFDEAGCHPWWGDFNDKGCTSVGSGKRRIESRLWNLNPQDEPAIMCSSTPAEFHGLKFDGAQSCANWGRNGYGGIWFVEDRNC